MEWNGEGYGRHNSKTNSVNHGKGTTMKNLPDMSAEFAQAEKERQDRLASNPGNGRLGWWRVDGIRHNAIVKASSALEAVEKAEKDEAVHDWEMADAWFISEELPDVISL